jgi:predicted nucleic acid-binding protein
MKHESRGWAGLMLVIDANIAIILITNEPGRNAALERLAEESQLIAPDWILVEVANVLWRKVKMGFTDRTTAEIRLKALPEYFEALVSAKPLITQSQKLAFELDHWVYDCHYLALALDQGVKLLTADRKFWNAAQRAGYGGAVELLTWEGRAA